jgi:putative transposase
MRFAFIATEKAHYQVALLCRVLRVSGSLFYAWQHRPTASRTIQDQSLGREIAAIFAESRGRYGSPRVHGELRVRGQQTGRHRVARLMRIACLRARKCRRFRCTTDCNYGMAITGNLLARRLLVPDTGWVTDITYL